MKRLLLVAACLLTCTSAIAVLEAGSADARTPAPSLVFEGTSNPDGCGGCTPPDTTGDVGPNDYVQVVNSTKVAIYAKDGTLKMPIFNLSTVFTSGYCSTSDTGDPQVLYAELADRWLLAQFTDSDQLCFAISQTPDPAGAYFTYAFAMPSFPDYFKVGVWPTGYYVSTNEATYAAYAFDRTKMLAGDQSASVIGFPGETNFMLPADVDGSLAPSPQGGLFYTFKDDSFVGHGGGVDRIEVFQLTPDFVTPGNSTFTTVATIPISSFTYTICGFFNFDCIPQPGTASGLDALSEWPMQRFAYRRFAGHESLVGNFTVNEGAGRAGIRWFELRDTGSGYSLFQEGTWAPDDGLNRWMGSIAMDGDGNIALGYSVSSSTVFPGIRYATRNPSDPPGTLQDEQTMVDGGGSQTSIANRWGDYSAMSVDPSRDCDFWYTNEFYPATSEKDWHTAIGTFRDPTCPPKTTIDSGPSGTTGDDTPTFTFSSNEVDSTFQCRVDGAAFGGCSGPGDSDTTAALGEGAHTFSVRAVDPASNPDPDPPTRSFTVDTSPPVTTIDSGPSGTTGDNTPTFTFSSNEAGSTFRCRVDSAAFGACSGPGDSDTTPALADGPHTFEVVATDPSSNAGPIPASRSFTVDTTARISKVKVNGPARVKKGRKAAYKVRVTNSGRGAATGVRLKVTGRGTGFNAPVGRIAAGHTTTIRLKIRFRKPGKVKVTFRASSSNAGGRSVTKRVRVRK